MEGRPLGGGIFLPFWGLFVNICLTFTGKPQKYHLNALKKRLFQPLSEGSFYFRAESSAQKIARKVKK